MWKASPPAESRADPSGPKTAPQSAQNDAPKSALPSAPPSSPERARNPVSRRHGFFASAEPSFRCAFPSSLRHPAVARPAQALHCAPHREQTHRRAPYPHRPSSRHTSAPRSSSGAHGPGLTEKSRPKTGLSASRSQSPQRSSAFFPPPAPSFFHFCITEHN